MRCRTATDTLRRKPRRPHHQSLFRQLGQSLFDYLPARPLTAANRVCGLYLECLEDRDLLSINHANLAETYLPPQYHLFEYSGYLTEPSSSTPASAA